MAVNNKQRDRKKIEIDFSAQKDIDMLMSEAKDLFNSIVRVLAVTIDAKSRYTGNHVQRVALLNVEIAKAVSNDQNDFPDVIFNADELEEIRLAGWLHDIGKVITPVWVMDKANKLQGINDGMELIRDRYLTAINELENMQLTIKRDGGSGTTDNDPGSAGGQTADPEELRADLQLIMDCNNPGEFLDDQKIRKLHRIARKTYIYNGREMSFLTEQELYNLSVRKGSLNREELETMRDHVTWTRKMLEKIPFPSHLKNVPVFAGQHHEKLNGTGYPLQLTAEQIPIQSRILAIADFYEALSAEDRPYKKKIPYKQIIAILKKAADNNEIDRNILKCIIDNDVFIRFENDYQAGCLSA